MEDTEESPEDTEGRKKSKLKSLKSRLFGRSRKSVTERNVQLSQSASDIAAGTSLGSDEDLARSQGPMGSRAFSHDSIFLADAVLADAEPAKVSSQENVHSKIKSLQMKLQQQKLHLGPPPPVLPVRHPDDPDRRSGADCLPHSPTEVPGGDTDTTPQSDISKVVSPSFSPFPKPALTEPVPPAPSLSLPFVSPPPSSTSAVEPPVDFSSPAARASCLDNSAARHRMSIKPRNQRASTKRRVAAVSGLQGAQRSVNNINHPETVKEDERPVGKRDEAAMETEQGRPDSPVQSQPSSKCPEVAPVTPDSAPMSPVLTSQRDDPISGTLPPVAAPVVQAKPHRPLDRERPHSAFFDSEPKDKQEVGVDAQVTSHEKRSAPIKTAKAEDSSEQPSSPFSSVVSFRSSSFHKQIQGEMEGAKGLKRPGQGSGSFHVSVTTAKAKDGERPRSSSFVEPLEQPKARNKAMVRPEDKPFSSLKEKKEQKDLQPRGGSFAMGRLRREGSPPKSSVLPWERKDSAKKMESVKTSKDEATEEGPKESESNQEAVEEAVEAKEVQEEEAQTHTFGVRLRPTSQAMRFRSDASSISRHSKPPVCEEQGDKPKQQETSKKLPTNIPGTPSGPGDVRPTNAASSGSCLPDGNHVPSTGDALSLETKSSDPRQASLEEVPQESLTAPQPAPSEVSWVALAMEKTRSLQQLFTSRLPREFSAKQTTLRPQARGQSTNPTEPQNEAQAQAVKRQASATASDAAKASEPATAPSSREPQPSTQVTEPQSGAHAPAQADPWATQPPLRSATQTDTAPQPAQGAQAAPPVAQSVIILSQHEPLQQAHWSQRGSLRASLKAATPGPTSPSATPAPPSPASARGEREADAQQDREGSSQPARRAVWGATVSARAALLEKQAEPTNPAGTKGVELRKAHADAQAPSDTTRTAAGGKDPKPDGREGLKPAESSPIKVPDSDKWPRKNVASSSPSSSPVQPSALQTVSESGQPSWMELAKRKSMAWNDRTMD